MKKKTIDFEQFGDAEGVFVRPRTPVRGVFYRKALDGRWYWVKKLLGIYWLKDRK